MVLMMSKAAAMAIGTEGKARVKGGLCQAPPWALGLLAASGLGEPACISVSLLHGQRRG